MMDLQRFESAAFTWGRMDCCMFVADVLMDIHGKDFAAPWRGSYDSEFGAKRIVVKHGGLHGLLSSVFGPMLPASQAKEGDPVLFGGKLVARDSIGAALGICHDNQIVYLTKRGLARAPLAVAVGCWNV